jgi:glycosyltransferase involved in cell wall biosynthesis
MRIGIHADAVTHAIPGGIGAYVAGLIDGLLAGDGSNEEPDELVLLLSRGGGTLPRWTPAPPVERSRLGVRALYPAWNYLGVPRVATRLDVVHATAMVVPPAREAALVATVHDFAVERFPEVVPTPWRQLYRRGLRRALGRAAVVCANSTATRDEVIERHRLDPARVIVTPLAGAVGPATHRDTRILERLGLTSPFILHVGTIEPRKNQVGLVQAFAAVADALPDHRLVLAGAPGWDAGRAAEAVAGAGLTARVTVTGRVSDPELAALYGAASVFAFPSRYEGFGIPLLEAMAFGIPSVAGDVPALREVAGDAAVLVAPDDIDGLAAALQALAGDDALRARLAAAGPARAAHFSWARTAQATRAAYRMAAAQR